MIGTIAQQESGAIVLFEHRFFGLSNPYPDLSEESLRYLSVQKNIDDMIYFARNVELPMAGGDAVTPDEAPWVLIGASYAGAVVGWTMHQNPGIFYAGYSSSGVVEAITDFWRYFEPIRLNMPANCSSDVQAAVARIDEILDSGDVVAIQQLKETFGMGNVTYSDDFATALSTPLGFWQSLNPSVGPNSPFFQFCDALEVDTNNQTAPSEGWGVDHALSAYGKYFIDEFGITGDETWGTHDGTTDQYTNITIDNFERSWLWIVCNEVGWYQTGAPEGHPTLVSRYVDVASNQLICQLMFPNTFPEPPLPHVDEINSVFGGWDAHPERVVFVNAINDPWLEATVSSHSIDYQSTPLTPVLVGDGFHHAEVIMVNGELDPILGDIQQKVLGYMRSWLADWTPSTA
ncbi:peptidase S28 [Mucidula mucida]|nr:peptidase S28 [Mucidula mucida]